MADVRLLFAFGVRVVKGLDDISGTDVSWRSPALACERGKWGGEAAGLAPAPRVALSPGGCVPRAGLLGRAGKAGWPFGNILVCILGLGGQRRQGRAPPVQPVPVSH